MLSRRHLLGSLSVGSLGVLLPCGCPRPAVADGPGGGPWDYGNFDGPPRWGGVCGTGRRQSPIDLPPPEGVMAPKGKGINIALDYSKAAKLTIINTGHGNIQVNVPDGSTCTMRGRNLKLVQWHFHTPSEHSFGRKRQVMEAHFVHKDTSTGELAVLGIMLQRGINCQLEALQVALDHAPMPGEPEYITEQPMDLVAMLQDILPGAGKEGGHYAHYVGSLTTPPCTEGVQWYVATQASKVSDSQVLDFQDAIAARRTLGLNSRPLQGIEIDVL